jgi:hypothetical protein
MQQMMILLGAGVMTTIAVVWSSVAGLAQETTGTVPVCVGADRVLRFVEIERNCRAGELRFMLASATVVSKSEESEGKKPAKKPNQSSNQSPSTRDGVPTKVTAPFEVVDGQGKTIMRVTDDDGTWSRGAYILNDKGGVAALVGVLTGEGNGGRILVRDGKGSVSRHVQMAYTSSGPLFGMKGDNDKWLFLMNQQGSVWYNNNEVPAVSLGAGESGSKGVFKIADENGTSVVEAGSLQGGRGIVRVYPSRGQTPLNIPQFLMGSKP